jgi:hypothetical protein
MNAKTITRRPFTALLASIRPGIRHTSIAFARRTRRPALDRTRDRPCYLRVKLSIKGTSYHEQDKMPRIGLGEDPVSSG